MTGDATSQYPDFPGTPTFVINGKMVENTRDLGVLEPKLRGSGEMSASLDAWRLAVRCLAVPGSRARLRKRRPGAARMPTGPRTFAETPDGGFRMGNPKAKIAVVEYGSLTCPHCRHFAETGMKPLLANMCRPGKASYEFRSTDPERHRHVAATLRRAVRRASRFFPWPTSFMRLSRPGSARSAIRKPQTGSTRCPQDENVLGVAKVAGLAADCGRGTDIVRAKAEQCLKSDAALDRARSRWHRRRPKLGVQGTPTFFVNGKLRRCYDWASLEPFLKDAGQLR